MSGSEQTGDRILVVDDNRVNRRLLSSILSREGYVPVTASDGERALRAAAAEPPDLILLDVEMPGMDGFEVLAAVKAEAAHENVPVLFITARSDTADKVRGLELGAVDYITKPFNRSEVLARVRTQLRIKHLTCSLVQKQERLDEDLSAAADIQRSLIHGSGSPTPGVDVAGRFEPCESIGGDIFNTVTLAPDLLGIYVLDVSGHGVPSAMVTVSVARSLSLEGGLVVFEDHRGEPRAAEPQTVLERLEDEYPMERFDKYFTIAYLVLNLRTGRLAYSSAAHPPPLVVRGDGRLRHLREGGSLIGLGLGVPFEQGEVKLERGDRLFLYTDGIIEQPDAEGRPFGEERLEELIVGSREQSLERACDVVTEEVALHSGRRPPRDDMSLFAIEFRGRSANRVAA